MSRIGLTGTPAPSTIFTPATPPAVEDKALLADILIASLFNSEIALSPLLDTEIILNPLLDTDTTLN